MQNPPPEKSAAGFGIRYSICVFCLPRFLAMQGIHPWSAYFACRLWETHDREASDRQAGGVKRRLFHGTAENRNGEPPHGRLPAITWVPGTQYRIPDFPWRIPRLGHASHGATMTQQGFQRIEDRKKLLNRNLPCCADPAAQAATAAVFAAGISHMSRNRSSQALTGASCTRLPSRC